MQLKVSQSTLFWDFTLCSEVNRPAGICVNCGHTPDEKISTRKKLQYKFLHHHDQNCPFPKVWFP